MQDGRTGTSTSSIAIDTDVLKQAHDAGLDVTALAERALRLEISKIQRADQWRTDNKATIEAWNDEVRDNGLWSDGLRQF